MARVSPMKTAASRIVGVFIPPSVAPDSSNLHRYQLFVAVNLSLVVVIFLAQLYAILLSGQSAGGTLWTLAFTLPLQLWLFGAVMLFRLTKRFDAAVNSSLGLMFLTVAGVIAFLGGPLGSVSVSLLFAPPIFAFVLLGLKAGLIWAVSVYVVVIAGGVMELMGVAFPDIEETPNPQIGELIHLSVAYFTVMVMIVLYELSNRRYRKELKRIAQRDDLTRLPNRTAFYQYIGDAIAYYESRHIPFALAYIDLNNFKPVNDEHGHAAGDKALRVFSERLTKVIRSQDQLCRLAGDEFAILLNDCVDERLARLVVERLRRQMEEPIILDSGHSITLSASIGLAYYPRDAMTLEALLHVADERMYRNKREVQRQYAIEYSD